jgi:hypothetical protein
MAKDKQYSTRTLLKRNDRLLKTPKQLPPSHPERIFKQAEDFEHAADVLRLDWEGRALRYHLHLPSARIPHIVCSAFCLELFLKCLLRIENVTLPKRTHALLELFELLRRPTKRKISALFGAEHPENSFKYFAASFAVNFRNSGSRQIRPTLRTVLKQSSNAFIEWRYLFEDTKPHTYSANHAISAVKRVILEIHPEWLRQTDTQSTSRTR